MALSAFQTAEPPVTASITNTAASVSVAAPANAEFVRLTTTVLCNVRWGVGAQTAVATDMLVMPNESVIIKLVPSRAYTFASIGAAGQLSITEVVPA
jgi:hypothetical protein